MRARNDQTLIGTGRDWSDSVWRDHARAVLARVKKKKKAETDAGRPCVARQWRVGRPDSFGSHHRLIERKKAGSGRPRKKKESWGNRDSMGKKVGEDLRGKEGGDEEEEQATVHDQPRWCIHKKKT